MNGANVLLLPTIIAQNLARHLDAATDGRVRYDPPFPDRLDQLVPGDQAIAVAHKEGQQLYHLGFGGYGITVFRKLETAGIQYKLIEGIEHLGHLVSVDHSILQVSSTSGGLLIASDARNNHHSFIKSPSSNLAWFYLSWRNHLKRGAGNE